MDKARDIAQGWYKGKKAPIDADSSSWTMTAEGRDYTPEANAKIDQYVAERDALEQAVRDLFAGDSSWVTVAGEDVLDHIQNKTNKTPAEYKSARTKERISKSPLGGKDYDGIVRFIQRVNPNLAGKEHPLIDMSEADWDVLGQTTKLTTDEMKEAIADALTRRGRKMQQEYEKDNPKLLAKAYLQAYYRGDEDKMKAIKAKLGDRADEVLYNGPLATMPSWMPIVGGKEIPEPIARALQVLGEPAMETSLEKYGNKIGHPEGEEDALHGGNMLGDAVYDAISSADPSTKVKWLKPVGGLAKRGAKRALNEGGTQAVAEGVRQVINHVLEGDELDPARIGFAGAVGAGTGGLGGAVVEKLGDMPIIGPLARHFSRQLRKGGPADSYAHEVSTKLKQYENLKSALSTDGKFASQANVDEQLSNNSLARQLRDEYEKARDEYINKIEKDFRETYKAKHPNEPIPSDEQIYQIRERAESKFLDQPAYGSFDEYALAKAELEIPKLKQTLNVNETDMFNKQREITNKNDATQRKLDSATSTEELLNTDAERSMSDWTEDVENYFNSRKWPTEGLSAQEKKEVAERVEAEAKKQNANHVQSKNSEKPKPPKNVWDPNTTKAPSKGGAEPPKTDYLNTNEAKLRETVRENVNANNARRNRKAMHEAGLDNPYVKELMHKSPEWQYQYRSPTERFWDNVETGLENYAVLSMKEAGVDKANGEKDTYVDEEPQVVTKAKANVKQHSSKVAPKKEETQDEREARWKKNFLKEGEYGSPEWNEWYKRHLADIVTKSINGEEEDY